jgi:hypothetical protein
MRTMRLTSLARSTALAALALLVAGPALATTLCAKRSGRVVVRPACKPRETAVPAPDAGLLGAPGPQGAAGATGPVGMVPFDLEDATGKPFGTVLSFDSVRVVTVVRVPGVDVPLQFVVLDGQFVNEGAIDARYGAANCAGPPFLIEGGSVVPVAHVIGTVVYFARTAPTTHALASQEFVATDCGAGTPTARGTCCRNATLSPLGAPAETFPVAALGVTPPFTLVPR